MSGWAGESEEEKSPAASQDILKWRRRNCDAPEFIELFYDTRRLLDPPIRV